jgi:hypothetical protein
VIDEVGADAGVEAKLDGELEFAADAVGGGDEDGVRKALGIESKESGEATDFAEHVLVEGSAGEALDAVVGEDVAISGDDGVVVVAGSAGFLVWGWLGLLLGRRRGGSAFTRRLLIVAGD